MNPDREEQTWRVLGWGLVVACAVLTAALLVEAVRALMEVV